MEIILVYMELVVLYKWKKYTKKECISNEPYYRELLHGIILR
jgi:hypothetical protein